MLLPAAIELPRPCLVLHRTHRYKRSQSQAVSYLLFILRNPEGPDCHFIIHLNPCPAPSSKLGVLPQIIIPLGKSYVLTPAGNLSLHGCCIGTLPLGLSQVCRFQKTAWRHFHDVHRWSGVPNWICIPKVSLKFLQSLQVFIQKKIMWIWGWQKGFFRHLHSSQLLLLTQSTLTP